MKQTGEQKVARIEKLTANGMSLGDALETVGLARTSYWKIRKRIRERVSECFETMQKFKL